MKRTARLWTAAAAVVAVATVTACSDDGGKAETAPTPSASQEITTVVAPTTASGPAPSTTKAPTVVSVEVQPGTGSGFEGAKDDVGGLTCARDGDVWKAAGTVTNPTDVTVDYRIYVALLDASNDTRGLFQVDAAGVAVGATADWSGSLAVAEDGLTCVLRVERTARA